MYLYKEKAYTVPDLLTALGLPQDTPNPLPEIFMHENGSQVTKLRMVMPPYDEEWQYLSHDSAVLDPINKTYTPSVHTIRQYALVNNYDIVVDLSRIPADGWIPVPYALNRHINIGWRYLDDTESFAPPSILAFKSQLKTAAEQTAEEARNTLSRPIGPTEIGTWLMNYVGVSLHLSNLPTPLWDRALAVESGLTGETVESLRDTHIQRASEYHALAAMTQGFSRKAKVIFANTDGLEALIAAADQLRQQGANALANPHSYLDQQ